MHQIIAYQGIAGAYSFIAAGKMFPHAQYLPCFSFADAFSAVQNGMADYAVIPIENSTAGQVTESQLLMESTNLKTVAEYYLRIEHQLIGLKGSKLSDIKTVISHPQALAQCSNFINRHHLRQIIGADTAGSCPEISARGDVSLAAIASRTAAQIYDLEILAENIEDNPDNTTRFLVLAR